MSLVTMTLPPLWNQGGCLNPRGALSLFRPYSFLITQHIYIPFTAYFQMDLKMERVIEKRMTSRALTSAQTKVDDSLAIALMLWNIGNWLRMEFQMTSDLAYPDNMRERNRDSNRTNLGSRTEKICKMIDQICSMTTCGHVDTMLPRPIRQTLSINLKIARLSAISREITR